MSSKTKTTATKKEATPALEPKLRFPEFREVEAWDVMKLNALLFEAKHRNRTLELGPADVLSVSGEHGCVNQIEFMGRSYAGVTVKDYHVVEHGDIVYTKSPLKRNPFGIIKENKGKRGIVSTLYAVYRPFPGCSATYLDHFFSVDYNLNAYLQPIVKKGAKNDMKVNNADVLKGDICVPKLPEQQKIAECLSSADELMAAQAQKVDALKTHKKALMQQLFPREGETQPTLRFPEFQNAGEWEVKAIGDVFRVTRGEVLSMTLVKDETSNEAPFPVYSSQTKSKGLAGYYSKYLYEDAITWTTDGANAGDVNFRPGKFYCTNVCGVLINTHGYANACVAALLNSVTRSHVSYVGNPKLMNGVMAKIVIPFPSVPEQQRIASCLSSLDALITLESQKLEALKTHKKGLMQQLFPSPDLVEA